MLERLGAWVQIQVAMATGGLFKLQIQLRDDLHALEAVAARIEAAQERQLLLLTPAARRLSEPERPSAQDWDEIQRQSLHEFEEIQR